MIADVDLMGQVSISAMLGDLMGLFRDVHNPGLNGSVHTWSVLLV